MGDDQTSEQAADLLVENPAKKRERTLIAFPYTDLQRGTELSMAIANGGGRSLEITQIAAALNQTATGGTFRGRLGAARMFGLIEYSGETATLTELGEAIIDPIRAPGAKVEAFLRVPLYAKLYEQYKGYQLPNAAAIQRQMGLLGVPKKQVERARQAFAQSVQFAGFINQSGRVVKPIVTQRLDSDAEHPSGVLLKREEAAPPPPPPSGGGSGGGEGGGGNPSSSHSQMLLELLDPEAMTEEEAQAVWTLLLYVKKSKKNGD